MGTLVVHGEHILARGMGMRPVKAVDVMASHRPVRHEGLGALGGSRGDLGVLDRWHRRFGVPHRWRRRLGVADRRHGGLGVLGGRHMHIGAAALLHWHRPVTAGFGMPVLRNRLNRRNRRDVRRRERVHVGCHRSVHRRRGE